MTSRCFFALAALLLSPLLTSCTHYFYRPDHRLYDPPELTGYAKEDFYFAAADGNPLHAWYFASTAPGPAKGTLVHFHGNSSNISSNYLSLAWLTAQGYNLFTFDYRGYGESKGSPDEAGTYLDGLAALNFAWQLHARLDPPSSRFVVYAHSLGGVIALRSFVDFAHQDGTSLLVLDSTFMSYRDVAQGMLARRWFSWPVSPLARVFISDAYASKKVIDRLRTPLLVSHDRRDPVVPFGQGVEVFEAAPGLKQFWARDQGVHAGLFSLESNKGRFLALLERLGSEVALDREPDP